MSWIEVKPRWHGLMPFDSLPMKGRTPDMQNDKACTAKTRSTFPTLRPLGLVSTALLTSLLASACSISEADATMETSQRVGQDQQALAFERSAPCRTAPARNSVRKLTSVGHVFGNSRQLTTILVRASTGTEFGEKQYFAVNDGGFSSTDRWSSGDFDGDGDQDLIAAWNNGGTTALAFRQAVGNSFVTSHVTIASAAWSAETVWVPGNFNATGAAELAAIVHDGASTSIDVYSFSFPAGIATRQRWVNQGMPWSATTKWSVGDFDYNGNNSPNDDTDDLVSVANVNGLTATVWLSNGNTFSSSSWSNVGGWSDYSTYVAGDFTGDGKADLAGIWDNSGVTSIAVYPSTGSAFAYPSQWITEQWPHDPGHHWVAGYFNNDNRADLVRMHGDVDSYSIVTTFLANSTGTGFLRGFFDGTTYWDWGKDTLCSGVFNAQ